MQLIVYIPSTNQILPHHNTHVNNQSVIATSYIQVLTNNITITILINQCPANRCTPEEPPWHTPGFMRPQLSNTSDMQGTLRINSIMLGRPSVHQRRFVGRTPIAGHWLVKIVIVMWFIRTCMYEVAITEWLLTLYCDVAGFDRLKECTQFTA